MERSIKMNIDAITKLINTHALSEIVNPSLFSNELLFISNLTRDSKLIEKGLRDILQRLNGITSTTFCDGIIGVGWLLQYLRNKNLLDGESVEELQLQIDEIAYNSALNFIKVKNHDFLHGATGNAIYLLDRVKENERITFFLTNISKELKKISKIDERGIYWEESEIFSKSNSDNNLVITDLSLSHGLASKIVLFSKLYTQNISSNTTRTILEGSVQFLLNCKNPKGSVSIFPSKLLIKSKDNLSRLSWCYGDLGISVALWQAGRALQNESITREAIDICLHTTKRRSVEKTAIIDAGICHGTSGVAHVYNRMFKYTGNQEFKEAADYWIEQTLKMSTFEDGLAGYKSCVQDVWSNQYGFLQGVSGIGLVLMSHINDEEPSWDRCLLLS